jgi:HSP20 family protein
LSEEEKMKKALYYSKKEKKPSEVKKRAEEDIVPYFQETQRDFERMMERFQREFEDFWEFPYRRSHRMRWWHNFPMMPFKEKMMPSVDLEDRGKEFQLIVDLPGFSKDDVKIEVSDDSVTINAEKNITEKEKKKNYVRQERVTQTFHRSIWLPENVNPNDTKASLTNGVLELTLPKKEPKATKKVKIS